MFWELCYRLKIKNVTKHVKIELKELAAMPLQNSRFDSLQLN